MLDRRGLIGSNVLQNCCSYYLKARQISLQARLGHMVRLLLYARGMILMAFIRKAFSYFYSQEYRSLDCPIPDSAEV